MTVQLESARMNKHDFIWVKIGMATASIITFVYGTFETKDHAKELMDHIIRIEVKIDRLLEQR